MMDIFHPWATHSSCDNNNNLWSRRSPNDIDNPWTMFRDLPRNMAETTTVEASSNYKYAISEKTAQGTKLNCAEKHSNNNAKEEARSIVIPETYNRNSHNTNGYSSPQFLSPYYDITFKDNQCNQQRGCSNPHQACFHDREKRHEHQRDNGEINWEEPKHDLPAAFQQDYGSRVDKLPCNHNDCECIQNQWSPFLQKSHTRSEYKHEMANEYAYNRRNSDTYYSEKSSYSTDSGDEDTEYEIIDWNPPSTAQLQVINGANNHNNYVHTASYRTPLSSPAIDHNTLDGYHTAPNSPQVPSDIEDFCIVDIPTEGNNNCENGVAWDEPWDMNNFEQFLKGQCATDESNLDNFGADSNEYASNKALETFTKSLTASLRDIGNNAIAGPVVDERMKSPDIHHKQSLVVPNMKMPTTISVDSIQYEADPKTGSVRTVGKGSFGQVFKARFADPMFHHLQIVVKEFDEEFTNKQEIIEEAQRLLYLGDTGYVPVCYGLVLLGDPASPTYGIIQEYIGSGLTLEQLLWDQYDLHLEIWVNIAVQCCDGLAQFHRKGILLNDIKTNNIILDFTEHSVYIKYIDFGLATDMRGKKYKNTKSLEDFLYLAPEVRKQGQGTTVASDIFSLGYMLDQIHALAHIQQIKLASDLCMDLDPGSRLPARAAASLIRDHVLNPEASSRYDGHVEQYDPW